MGVGVFIEFFFQILWWVFCLFLGYSCGFRQGDIKFFEKMELKSNFFGRLKDSFVIKEEKEFEDCHRMTIQMRDWWLCAKMALSKEQLLTTGGVAW